MKDWRLHLSNIIPMPFSTTYGRHNDAGKPCVAHHRWWQFRDRVLSQELTLLEIPTPGAA